MGRNSRKRRRPIPIPTFDLPPPFVSRVDDGKERNHTEESASCTKTPSSSSNATRTTTTPSSPSSNRSRRTSTTQDHQEPTKWNDARTVPSFHNPPRRSHHGPILEPAHEKKRRHWLATSSASNLETFGSEAATTHHGHQEDDDDNNNNKPTSIAENPSPSGTAARSTNDASHRPPVHHSVKNRLCFLQHKKQEYYTSRELLIMNMETPPRSKQELDELSRQKSSTRVDDGILPPAASKEPTTNHPSNASRDTCTTIHPSSPPMNLQCGQTSRHDTTQSITSHRPLDEPSSSLPLSTNRITEDQDKTQTETLSSLFHSNNDDKGLSSLSTSTAMEEENGPCSTRTTNNYRLYFVEKGRDMHPAILVGPKELAQRRGATLVSCRLDDDNDDTTHKTTLSMATHWIVSPSLSVQVLAETLRFDTVADLRTFVHHHGIVCCTREWVSSASAGRSLAPPRLEHNHLYRPLYRPSSPPTKQAFRKPTTTNHKDDPNDHPSIACPQRLYQPDDTTTLPASSSSTTTNALPPCRRRNQGISLMLETLAKLYQEAPLDPQDLWRSYTFQLIAGRVRHLTVELNVDNLHEHVACIPGIGSSSLALLTEYLTHVQHYQQAQQDDKYDEQQHDQEDGRQLRTPPEDDEKETSHEVACRRVQRIRHAQNDPERQAVRVLCQIWGVGRATALDLVRAGYRSIADIKHAMSSKSKKNGGPPLTRNQCLGLQCYHDFQEKMTETEVQAIGQIVQEAVRERFPNATVEILGSFRRQKGRYGDVDVLITHPKYVTTVPPRALGKIVQDLRRKGHFAHHLTWLPGMDEGEYNDSLPDWIQRHLGGMPAEKKTRTNMTGTTCSSYMGIFVSPLCHKKLRRIDIKFYPSRERIFALLYFTGNGYFNRSMRLWSLRKFHWTLNDHGLFEQKSKVRVMDSVHSEQQVFEKLKLVWKEPHERDSFDAVTGIDQTVSNLDGFSSVEFHQESAHQWID